MTGRTILGFCVACILCTCVGIFALKNRGKPVSAGFIGFAEGKELCEALVTLTNHSSASVRFQGLLTCSRLDTKQSIEVGRPVDLVMDGKTAKTVAVTVPFGAGPARVSCSVTVLGRHSALVRQLGTVLQKAGIHVYHAGAAVPALASSNPRPPRPPAAGYATRELSSLRLQIGGRRLSGSLSDWLLLQNYTNCWTTR